MSSCRPSYISSYTFTWDRPNNELTPVWLRVDCWTETRNSCTGLSSYRSYENDSKSQTGSRNFKPLCFSVSPYIFFLPKKHIISSRNQAPSISSRFHVNGAGRSSHRSEFVPVSYSADVSAPISNSTEKQYLSRSFNNWDNLSLSRTGGPSGWNLMCLATSRLQRRRTLYYLLIIQRVDKGYLTTFSLMKG